MTNTAFHLTQEGLNEISKELLELKEVKLPEAIDRVKNAREHGDLAENSEYHAAREDQTLLEGRIDELEELIAKAKLVRKTNNHKVNLGNQVTVKHNGGTLTFHVVGKYEADPMNRKISDESPLGKALLGKKVGDNVEYLAPVGKVVYTIHQIH